MAEAKILRKLEYTVTADMTPSVRKWGGMQYEHNATEVEFDISSVAAEGFVYRIDFNSAGAGYDPGNNIVPENGKIRRAIPQSITQYGGDVQVTAVISKLIEKTDTNTEDAATQAEQAIFSYPATVYFTPVDKNKQGSKDVELNISAMEASVKEKMEAAKASEEIARDAAATAVEAQEQTEFSRRTLEEGSCFVFSGGNAYGTVTQICSPLDCYPVGSVFLTTASTNPSFIFGGAWEEKEAPLSFDDETVYCWKRIS